MRSMALKVAALTVVLIGALNQARREQLRERKSN
jgi:hypothetical protein